MSMANNTATDPGVNLTQDERGVRGQGEQPTSSYSTPRSSVDYESPKFADCSGGQIITETDMKPECYSKPND